MGMKEHESRENKNNCYSPIKSTAQRAFSLSCLLLQMACKGSLYTAFIVPQDSLTIICCHITTPNENKSTSRKSNILPTRNQSGCDVILSSGSTREIGVILTWYGPLLFLFCCQLGQRKNIMRLDRENRSRIGWKTNLAHLVVQCNKFHVHPILVPGSGDARRTRRMSAFSFFCLKN